jgi:hypothetical protein
VFSNLILANHLLSGLTGGCTDTEPEEQEAPHLGDSAAVGMPAVVADTSYLSKVAEEQVLLNWISWA